MRRTLLMIMAVALLLTQCRKPEVKFPTPSSAEGVTVSMTVTAGPGSKTDITTAGAITWSSGDKLYVGYNGAYVGCLTLTSGQNTPTGWFSGDVTLPNGTNGEPTFHFFYLGRDNSVAPTYGAESVEVSFAGQEIYADNGKLKNASAQHVGYGSAKGTVTDGVVTGINVTLVSKVALAHFSFKKGGMGYPNALILSGTHIYNKMTVNFNGSFTHDETAGNISLTGSHSERYVMLVPVGTGSETLSFAGDGFEGSTTLGSGIEANKFYGRGEAIVVNLTKVPVPVTGVTVDPIELNLVVGGTGTLTATVTPGNADDKSVRWSSSDPGVATVSDAGLVTAVAAGSATITVTTEDGNKTATCEVTVTAAPTPAHEYVDLGLPSGLLWATCNLGASKPEEYGDYYAWGEILPYYADGHSQDNPCNTWRSMTTGAGNTVDTEGYAWKTYSQGGSDSFVEWTAKPYGSNHILTSDYDAATKAWGGGWRMPTEADITELINNTNRSWTTENGVYGWKCVNKSDANKYIFFPAAGRRNGKDLVDAGKGHYWSSTYFNSNGFSRNLYFDNGSAFGVSSFSRYHGGVVRPVCLPQN